MKIHRLKIEPSYFAELRRGVKTFEIRKNDRDYQVGDYLLFRCGTTWQGAKIIGGLLAERFPDGLQPGYCILSLRLCDAYEELHIVSEYLSSDEHGEYIKHERAQAAVNHVVAMRKSNEKLD